MSDPKFEFYEVVRVISCAKDVPVRLLGAEGAILGRTQGDQGDIEWSYAVTFEGEINTWIFMEAELEPTGRFKRREDFYDGSSIRVIVDPATGEGCVIESIIQPKDENGAK
jgi:hypothetical protein